MTPGILAAQKAAISHRIHEYRHDPQSESYGLEAAEKLGLDPARVFKTLVVTLDDGELAVAVIPVAGRLSMKRVAKALGAKRAAMAERSVVERTTGYVIGGVSPLGQKKRLRTAIDPAVEAFETVFVSAGRRGLEIELSPVDLLALTRGLVAPLCQENHSA